jgi:hypothetical protein
VLRAQGKLYLLPIESVGGNFPEQGEPREGKMQRWVGKRRRKVLKRA